MRLSACLGDRVGTKAGVGKWIQFYNRKRTHSALDGKQPAVVYWLRKEENPTDQQKQRVA
ncbi:MAG: hypothetical protein EpisKO_40730 [Epibacterium sp.]